MAGYLGSNYTTDQIQTVPGLLQDVNGLNIQIAQARKTGNYYSGPPVSSVINQAMGDPISYEKQKLASSVANALEIGYYGNDTSTIINNTKTIIDYLQKNNVSTDDIRNLIQSGQDAGQKANDFASSANANSVFGTIMSFIPVAIIAISAPEAAPAIGAELGLTGAAANAAGMAAIGATSSAVLAAGSGANADQIATAALVGGASGAVAGAAVPLAGEISSVVGQDAAQIIANAATGATKSVISGSDPVAGAAGGAAGAAAVEVGAPASVGSAVGGAINAEIAGKNVGESALVSALSDLAKGSISSTDPNATPAANPVVSAPAADPVVSAPDPAVINLMASNSIQSTTLPSGTDPVAKEMFNALKQVFADAQNNGNPVDAGTQYAVLAQALPASIVSEIPSTPIVPVAANQTGLNNFYGAAANDPNKLVQVISNAKLAPGFDEYFNSYGYNSPQLQQNYLSSLIAASQADPYYQPYVEEIQNLVTKFPTLANEQTNAILSQAAENPRFLPELNVEGQRPVGAITDLQINDFVSQGASQSDIQKLIQTYGYNGSDPTYSQIQLSSIIDPTAGLPQPKTPIAPSYPGLPQPTPATPSPNAPANDPNITPEPKVPGTPLTPIVPVSPPGAAPSQPTVPDTNVQPGTNPNAQPGTSPTDQPGNSLKTTLNLGTATVPATQPTPALKLNRGVYDPTKPITPPSPYGSTGPASSKSTDPNVIISPVDQGNVSASKPSTKTGSSSVSTISNILGSSSVVGNNGTSSSLSSALLGSSPAENPSEATGSPTLLGNDKRRDVWNLESLRGALGI